MVSVSKLGEAAVIVGATLLLAGCDSWPKAWSRKDINSIAYDAAEDVSDAQNSRLEVKINDLESRVSDLESKVRNLEN